MTTATVTRKHTAPTTADLDAAALELRARYIAADKGETDARTAFEAADIAWQNARVAKVRVAYAAAMLTPNKGEANLLAATRYLLTDPADTPAKRTAQAKSRKNTLRNYVEAGKALHEAGLVYRETEPDEEERKIVAAVFRELNKRDKAEAKAEAATDATEGDETAPAPEDAEAALTVTDLIGHVARMNATFNLLKSGGIVISEREAGKIAEMLAEFTAQLAEYSEGK